MSDDLQTAHLNPLEGVAIIGIFHTNSPEEQEIVLQSLIQITDEVTRHQTGFISVTMHRSLDGKTVTNIGRWHTVEDLKNALATPAMLAHRDALGTRFKRDGSVGRAVYTYYNGQDATSADQLQA